MSIQDWNNVALACVAGVLAGLVVLALEAVARGVPPYRDHDGGGL